MLNKLSNLSGLFFIALISFITLLAFYGLIAFNRQGADLTLLQDPYFHAILIFSIKQALLSAFLATFLAWPIARAIYYYPKIFLKNTFLSLALLCFVLPTLVLITGFVSLFGLSGIITPFLGDDWSLYGIQGILIAHVYMNLPFAVRALHNQLQNIPDSSWILSRQLKFNALQRFSLIEWPALRSTISLTFGFIVILCFNSFAVVLALGGGPQATTLEVAIYQALKYDFNISEALTLAWTQFFIAGVFFVALYRSSGVSWLSKESSTKRWLPAISKTKKSLFLTLYCSCFIFMLLPLLSLLPGVFAANYTTSLLTNVGQALALSLLLGFLAALIAMLIAYFIMLPIRHCNTLKKQRLQNTLQWLANHTLIAPAMVLSVGLYILFLPIIDLDRLGMFFVVILNILLILPFAMQQIRARVIQYDNDYAALYQSLKLNFWQRLSIEWPYIKPTMLSTFSLVLLIAMGDVAIFSIFGSDHLKTLPWLIYQYAGSYRLNEASFASAVLLIIYLLVLFNIERVKNHA
ncbi:MAG: thiamine transport system permease protein [Oceanospirillaceae bacterium]|jgi:thiamine transport system permease protein